jgi:hypothetical protein
MELLRNMDICATSFPKKNDDLSKILSPTEEEEELRSPKEAIVNRVYVCRTSLATP